MSSKISFFSRVTLHGHLKRVLNISRNAAWTLQKGFEHSVQCCMNTSKGIWTFRATLHEHFKRVLNILATLHNHFKRILSYSHRLDDAFPDFLCNQFFREQVKSTQQLNLCTFSARHFISRRPKAEPCELISHFNYILPHYDVFTADRLFGIDS